MIMIAHEQLIEAARVVRDDLHARIDEAANTGAPVPVFRGIADLASAIACAEGELEDMKLGPPAALTYRDFIRGPGGDMLRRLGLGWALGRAHGWATLRNLVIDWNDPDGRRGKPGRFVDAARRLDGVASSGERPLLHAIAAAMDFAWLADELAAGAAWTAMPSASGAHRRAILACILQEDRGP
jgi:hypothetical protein